MTNNRELGDDTPNISLRDAISDAYLNQFDDSEEINEEEVEEVEEENDDSN